MSDTTFVSTRSVGATAGFGNMLRKEMGSWWGTRRWLLHLVLWFVVINGFVLLVALSHDGKNSTPASKMSEVLEVFVQVGGFFCTIGAIIVAQGTIVGERHSGTAAWLLTKPIARQAFVLAKFVAILASFVTLAYLIPLVVLHLEHLIVFHTWPDPTRLFPSVGMILVNLIFYTAFTIMGGTLFSSRGAVNGVAIGFFIAGNIVPQLLPKWVVAATPWPLIQAAGGIAGGKPIPAWMAWGTVGVTLVWAVLCLLVALWRFNREEF
jgi:ABC-2 type transport system permease protein